MICSPPQESCGAPFFAASAANFFFGFQEHGRQGYLDDFGREKKIHPTGYLHDFRREKWIKRHFREMKHLSENSLIEKRSHSLLVECMGVSLKIVFLKTTFNSTKRGT